MISINNSFLIGYRYVNLYLHENYVLKPVICEERQRSVICHIEAVVEGLNTLTFFTLPTQTPTPFSIW